MTPPEIALWLALRQNEAGLRFRRQHAVGNYVLDFGCLAARLAIEIDGESHERGDRPYRDAVRDATLTRAGFRTLRLPAAAVLADLDAAVRAVVAACDQPLHHPAAPDGPPPRAGEV